MICFSYASSLCDIAGLIYDTAWQRRMNIDAFSHICISFPIYIIICTADDIRTHHISYAHSTSTNFRNMTNTTNTNNNKTHSGTNQNSQEDA